MPCDCSQFEPIELDRKSINRRIKQSPEIRKRLTQIAEHTDLSVYLFQCPECNQFWQSGHEWNFGDREYLFHVPPIEIGEWHREPYRQPAAMMIYSSVMARFFADATFEPTDSQCRAPNCTEYAVRFSVFCRDHHIDSLRASGRLVKKPVGRLFPPYS